MTIDWNLSQREWDRRNEERQRRERKAKQQSIPKCASFGCNNQRSLHDELCGSCRSQKDAEAEALENESYEARLVSDFEEELGLLESRYQYGNDVDAHDVVRLVRKLWDALEARRERE